MSQSTLTTVTDREVLVMRPAAAGPAGRLLHLLLAPAVVLLAAACDDTSSLQPPPITDGEVAAAKAPATATRGPGHWADGYASVPSPSSLPQNLFNRTGGAVTNTMPSGGATTMTFSGLSAFLGKTSTLHVTGLYYGQYCKPVEAYLVRDNVEVRCYYMGTGLPAYPLDMYFTIAVTRNYSDVAYAYADQPTSTNYSPADRGSWNPAGKTTVLRTGVGQYQVVFYELQRIVWDANNNGQWQVNAVGSDNVYCKLASAGGSTAMFANVRCFSPTGTPADSKFTVLFVLPSSHLAYAYNNRLSATLETYPPPPFDSWMPVGSSIAVRHYYTGAYEVRWNGVGTEIVPYGTTQVTAEGSDAVQCYAAGWGFDEPTASWVSTVECRSPNGQRADSRFRVMLGS